MRRYLPVVLIMLCASMACAWQGKCVGVSDGDTISVMHGGRAEKIRLHGVDCPEKTQAYGTRAKQFTSALVFGKVVTVDPVNTDRYGRTVAHVKCPDGRSLNATLVQAGMAWWYRQYEPHNQTLAALEQQARTKRLGLWADAHPTPPWEYRREANAKSASSRPASSLPTPRPAAASRPVAPAVTPLQSASTDLVYITSGNCFHRAGCQMMHVTPRTVTREEALRLGRRACQVCHP